MDAAVTLNILKPQIIYEAECPHCGSGDHGILKTQRMELNKRSVSRQLRRCRKCLKTFIVMKIKGKREYIEVK